MSARMMLNAAALLAAASAFPALAQDMAITNARVVVGDGGAPIEQGTVLVRAGKVIAAGAGVIVPAGVRTIDAKGGWVTPGLFVAVTNLGLFDVGDVDESNDEAATAQFNAALDVGPAINPLSQQVAVGRAGGITRAAIAPTGTTAIFAGQGAVIDLGVDGSPVTRARAFQYIELGETGAVLAGGSRVAAHAALRNALAEAQGFATRGDDVLLTRADAAALVPVVTGKQQLLIHVERAQDIRMVLALRVEFPALKLVIVGASEGWLVAKELAASGVPVIASPLNDLPAQFETLAATQSNVGRMTAAGVKVAIGKLSDNDQPRWAPQYAGNLVALNKVPGAKGLSWGQAFATISSIPAEILGLGESLGSLKPGRAGDIVIWDGDPLEVTSGVVAVYIDGVEQPLSNHQTRLLDRYRTPTEGSLPKAYDW